MLWQTDLAASAHGPAEEKADGRGGFDKVQRAGGGPEGQSWAPERGLTETSLREHHRTQGSDSSMTYRCKGGLSKPHQLICLTALHGRESRY